MTTNIKAKQLKLLLHDFELMSKTALTQFQIVTKLLENNSIEGLYLEVEENEVIMDRLEVKVREEIVFSIFQFAPKAADLRQIITYQETSHNLERIGDMLLNIAHYTKETNLSLSQFDEQKKIIFKMLAHTNEMLHDCIFSFSNADAHIAYKVIEADDEVDRLYHKLNGSLGNTFENKTLTGKEIKNVINISAIAQNLERIADNATNIAEATIYLTDGKDIRHGNQEK